MNDHKEHEQGKPKPQAYINTKFMQFHVLYVDMIKQ